MDGNSAASNAALRTSAREGARKVLLECLHLRTHEILGVVWDDTTAEVFSTFSDVASEAGIEVRHVRVPLEYQSTFGSHRQQQLERDIRDVLNESSAVITCTSDLTPAGKFRHELVKEGASFGRRLGHIPGATLALLAHAVNIDYDQVVQRCDDLALALTLGRTAEPGEEPKPLPTFSQKLVPSSTSHREFLRSSSRWFPNDYGTGDSNVWF